MSILTVYDRKSNPCKMYTKFFSDSKFEEILVNSWQLMKTKSLARSCKWSGKNTHPWEIRLVPFQTGFLGDDNKGGRIIPHSIDFYGTNNCVWEAEKWWTALRFHSTLRVLINFVAHFFFLVTELQSRVATCCLTVSTLMNVFLMNVFCLLCKNAV